MMTYNKRGWESRLPILLKTLGLIVLTIASPYYAFTTQDLSLKFLLGGVFTISLSVLLANFFPGSNDHDEE